MRNITLLSLFILIFFSCQRALEKPDNLLSKEDMTGILTDIFLYKQHPDGIVLTPESAFNTYVTIFKQHNTTKEIFQQSFAYYYADGDDMENIYDNVIKNLEGKLTKDQLRILKQKEAEEQRKKEEQKKKPKTNE